MKQTRAQLLERIDVLEGMFSSHMLRPLREEIRELRSQVDGLKKTLGEESAQKQHWEDCSKRIMLENEFLRGGRAGPINDPNGPLDPKYMRKPPGAIIPDQKPESWWRRLFNP